MKRILPEVLKGAGYRTGVLGKWHLGDQPEFLPTRQGCEGGMREATFIRWPGKIPAGKDNHELVTAMDLLPTFAKLAGAKIPADRIIDGKDVWAVLAGEAETPHEKFFYHRGNTLRAVRSGKWKLHTNNDGPTALFDLDNDIGETMNLLEHQPAVVDRLDRYMKEFADEIARNRRSAAFVTNPKPLTKTH